ncbi:14475_t:CDS:2, partial [Dentiscutata erythropus]
MAMTDDLLTFVINEKIVILGIGAALVLAIAFWIFGRCKDPRGNNFIVFNCIVILYDFIFETIFLINNSRDVEFLFLPTLLAFFTPLLVNLLMAFITIIVQCCIVKDKAFKDWFREHFRFAAVMTILAAADINFLRLVCSGYGKFSMFSCEFSTRTAMKMIVLVEFFNSFIEDIPQLTIQ